MPYDPISSSSQSLPSLHFNVIGEENTGKEEKKSNQKNRQKLTTRKIA
jgi:hypothetical protein